MLYIIIILYLYGYILTLELGNAIGATPSGRIGVIWYILIFFIWWIIITTGLLRRPFKF